MTKKDYVLIADRIRLSRVADIGESRDRTTWHAAVDDVANMLARGLENDNPRFDRARFLAACGVQS